MKSNRVAGNSYPSSQNYCECQFPKIEGNFKSNHTCMALFFWNVTVSSFFPMSITMEPTPPNNASFARLSAFHAEMK